MVVFNSSREDSDIKTYYALNVNSYVLKPLIYSEFSNVVRNIALYWLNWNEVSNSVL